jgi:hypothetical protein
MDSVPGQRPVIAAPEIGAVSILGRRKACQFHSLADPGCVWLDACGGVEHPSVVTYHPSPSRRDDSDKTPQHASKSSAARLLRNRAELSGEVSVGDVAAVGEAGLAVGHVGWTLVRGGLNEVRTDEHGTHPLPLDAQRGTGRLPSQEGQDDATRD